MVFFDFEFDFGLDMPLIASEQEILADLISSLDYFNEFYRDFQLHLFLYGREMYHIDSHWYVRFIFATLPEVSHISLSLDDSIYFNSIKYRSYLSSASLIPRNNSESFRFLSLIDETKRDFFIVDNDNYSARV